MRTARLLLISVLVLLSIAVVFAAGFGTHWLLSRPAPTAAQAFADAGNPVPATGDDFRVFWEAWEILERDFFGDDPSDQARTHGAVKGLAQSYQDPYTYFIEPQPRQREKEELSGEFGGIGAWISQDEQGNLRLDPMPERAAEKAGILKNDILIAVDGEPLADGAGPDDAANQIRGPVGEAVTIDVLRESSQEELAFEITRERFETPSVEWRVLPDSPGVGYVYIRLFSERTAAEIDRAIDELAAQGVSFLVIDMRQNTGGLLQAAVDVTSRFLPDGVILFERGSTGEETTYRATEARRAPGWPLTILVDQGTASAAEIMAGALQDRGRAALVGVETFGKGSVQLVHDLSDGSSIHVTVANWLTPNRHEIDGVGLTPDLEVPHEDGRDAPLEEAVLYLLGQRQASP